MTELGISGLPLIDEEKASGDVADTYGDIKRVLEIPFVPNIHKAVANSPTAPQSRASGPVPP